MENPINMEGYPYFSKPPCQKTTLLRVVPNHTHSYIVSDIPSGCIYGICILAFYLNIFLAYTLIFYLPWHLVSHSLWHGQCPDLELAVEARCSRDPHLAGAEKHIHHPSSSYTHTHTYSSEQTGIAGRSRIVCIFFLCVCVCGGGLMTSTRLKGL